MYISSSSMIPGEHFLRQRRVKIPRTSYYAEVTVPAYTLDDVRQHTIAIIAFEVCWRGMQPRRSPSKHFHSARNETSFHLFLGIARIHSAPFIPRPESELHRTNAVQCIKQTLRNQNTAEWLWNGGGMARNKRNLNEWSRCKPDSKTFLIARSKYGGSDPRKAACTSEVCVLLLDLYKLSFGIHVPRRVHVPRQVLHVTWCWVVLLVSTASRL